jgi:hypothetical protein
MTRKTTLSTNDRRLSKDLEQLQSDWERMERAEPPGLLDQAVLNTARRDLESKKRRRPLRWLGGFATATVAVLAITVVWLPERPADLPPPDATGVPAPQDKAAALMQESAPEARDTAPRIDVQKTRRLNAAPAPAADAPALEMEARRGEKGDFMASESDAVLEEEALLPPEAWIKQLLALKQEGRIEELEAGLRAFREAYPEHPLPGSLGQSPP